MMQPPGKRRVLECARGLGVYLERAGLVPERLSS